MRSLNQELSKLSTDFSNKLLAGTKAGTTPDALAARRNAGHENAMTLGATARTLGATARSALLALLFALGSGLPASAQKAAPDTQVIAACLKKVQDAVILPTLGAGIEQRDQRNHRPPTASTVTMASYS